MSTRIAVKVIRQINDKVVARSERIYSSDEALNQAYKEAINGWKASFKNCSSCDVVKFSNHDFAYDTRTCLGLYATKDESRIVEHWEITSIQSSLSDVVDEIAKISEQYKALHKAIPHYELGCLFKTVVNGMSNRDLSPLVIDLAKKIAKTKTI